MNILPDSVNNNLESYIKGVFKMKKLIIAFLAAGIAITLTACKTSGTESPKNTAAQSSVPVTKNIFENGLVKDENGIIGDEANDKRNTEDPVSKVVSGTGEAVENIGNDVGSTVNDIGRDIGNTVDDVGKNVGSSIEDIGEGAGKTADDIAKGAGSLIEDAGEGAGKSAGDIGDSMNGKEESKN